MAHLSCAKISFHWRTFMKKFKNLVAAFAVLVLIFSCFVACLSEDDNPAVVSIWNDKAGRTLTFYDDNTWEFVNNEETYKGTYKEEGTAGIVGGQATVSVVASYDIIGDTITLVITNPFQASMTLTKK